MEPLGFHLYSSYIARDTSLSVDRKFAVLNTRNILYLQSELANLEVQPQRLDTKADSKEVDNDIWAIPRSWQKMLQEGKTAVPNAHESQNPRESWSVVLKIRKVLKEYSRAPSLTLSFDQVPILE